MRRSTTRSLAGILVLSQLVFGLPASRACTGIRILPADGSVICARTLEFGMELESDILVVPRARSFVATAPGDRPGLRWTSKYAAVGANAFHLPLIVDGLNEQGLGVGLF